MMRPLRRTSARNSQAVTGESSAHRQPRPVIAACNVCRQRKTRCDGNRPVCGRCHARGFACGWQTAQRPHDVIRNLRELPHEEAIDLLHDIRQSSSFGPSSSIAPLLQHGNLFGTCLVAKRNDLEFELAVRYPIAYPIMNPIPFAGSDAVDILEPRRLGHLHPISHCGTASQYSHELGATTDIHRRLRNVEFGKWTDIEISGDLAARIISLYFQIDYPTLPVFHVDLFLDDLISGRCYFCSRLLFSALLGWACQAYAAIDSSVACLSAKFFAEAESVLSHTNRLNTLTTVSALQLLSMTAFHHGNHETAQSHIRQGIRVGQSMGLFNVASSEASATSWLNDDADWLKATSYTAWGAFNWATMCGQHYHVAEIHTPPMITKPGEVERLICVTNSQTILKDVDLQVFKACCKLWSIFHKVLLRYPRKHDERTPDTTLRWNLAFAEDIYRQTLECARDFPLNLVRGTESPHSVFMMHIYLHAVVLKLFQPDLQNDYQIRYFSSFETKHATPEAAHAASANQLRHLILGYITDYPQATLSVSWQAAVMYLENMLLANTACVAID